MALFSFFFYQLFSLYHIHKEKRNQYTRNLMPFLRSLKKKKNCGKAEGCYSTNVPPVQAPLPVFLTRKALYKANHGRNHGRVCLKLEPQVNKCYF